MGTQHKEASARQRIASNIRVLRQARGLSQEDLAELAGFHRTLLTTV